MKLDGTTIFSVSILLLSTTLFASGNPGGIGLRGETINSARPVSISGGSVGGTGVFSTFLTEEESLSIPIYKTSFGVTVMSLGDFERNSEYPANVLHSQDTIEGSFLLIERDGEFAFLLDQRLMMRFNNQPIFTFLGKVPRTMDAAVCDSSCVDDILIGSWDGFISGGSGGAAIGAGVGGGAGFYVAGPAGAGAGAAMGGAGGAVVGGVIGAGVGGVKGAQSCEKEKEAAGCQAE